VKESPYESSWNRQERTNELPEDSSWRGSAQDGLEIQSLLGQSSIVEGVDEDWEQELLAIQRKNHSVESTLPRDPLLSSSTSFSRSQAQHLPGDLSPTSSELLSSLSSLDLSSLAYLKTLLSLPPEQAVQRYFDSTESNYTEDVWGLPKEVKEVFERAKEGTGKEEENGKEKAVRRLGMLMKHLQLDGTASVVSEAVRDLKGKGRANEREELEAKEAGKDPADLAREEWAKEWEEYPLAASHVRSPPRSYFEVRRVLSALLSLRTDVSPLQQKSLPPVSSPPPPQEFKATILPYPLPSHSASPSVPIIDETIHPLAEAHYSVPSSLSSEAFVVHGYSNSTSSSIETNKGYARGVYHEVPGGRGGTE